MSLPQLPLGIPEEARWKTRLQEFTQKASIPLPVYETSNEGVPHAPLFQSRVWVDGICFISSNTFSNRKMAEQDAAKLAFICTVQKVKEEGYSLIRESTVFCKMIVNEYALKMGWTAPTYTMNESNAPIPTFISSLVLNGVAYVGDVARSKKEAEQSAARSAILSILESESSTTMSEIVKSKYKLYDPGMGPTHGSGITPSVNKKRKEVDVSAGNIATGPFAHIPPSPQMMHPQFKKPTTGTPIELVPVPLIQFVPASWEQGVVSSVSGQMKNQKNKKKKKKKKVEC